MTIIVLLQFSLIIIVRLFFMLHVQSGKIIFFLKYMVKKEKLKLKGKGAVMVQKNLFIIRWARKWGHR